MCGWKDGDECRCRQIRFLMARALELAALARGKTSPNPMVGAVVVCDGAIIGEGYHRKAGTPHAEILALGQAGERARGATLYVSLEPCCHFGRTPPCTRAIIDAGITRVVAATLDPNLLVAGKGLQSLRQAGLEVRSGVLETDARRLNEAFFKYIVTGQPFITLKAAMSLDGKIATRSGDSKWITGPEPGHLVQHLRAEKDAVLVGIGTVLADDPLLTVQAAGQDKQPLRVIADSNLKIPLESRIVQTAQDYPTAVAGVEGQMPGLTRKSCCLREGLRSGNCQMLDGQVDIQALLRELGSREVTDLLLEGGSASKCQLFQGEGHRQVYFLCCPLDHWRQHGAPGPFGGAGAADLAGALHLTALEYRKIGADLMIVG